MAVSVTCPGCGTSYPVTDELLGKTIRCKKCQETFVARAAKTTVAAGRTDERITTRPASKATVRDEYDDDAPRANGKTNGKPRPAPAKKPAKKGGNTGLIVGGALAGVLVLGLGGALVWALNREPTTDPKAIAVAPPPKATLGNDLTVPVESKPKDEPKPKEEPKAVQAAKIENNLLPGFVRKPRPADFRPDIVEKVKKPAAWIQTTLDGGMATGSGWVAEKSGDERYVVTNAHVIDMKERAKGKPDGVHVVFHTGTDEETKLEARIMAVDHEEDLAVLRVKGRTVKGNPLPDPFEIAPSYDLMESQRLMTLGFPYGTRLKNDLKMGLGADIKITLKTRATTVAGRVPNKDGSIKYIQVEGGIDPGNSGGGVVDTNGNIVAVVVAQQPGTNIKFIIPSEYVVHLLLGRVLKVIPGQAVKSGSGIKQPIRVEIADPLRRLKGITGEIWVGKPGKIRPATNRQPDAVEGDGPRSTVSLMYNEGQDTGLGQSYRASAELSLPQIKDGEVFWFQPHYVGKDGKDRWGEAIVLEMGRYPVEPKGANLSVKHKVDVKPDERRAIILSGRQFLGYEIEGLGGSGRDLDLTASLTERVKEIEKDGDARVRYQYTDIHLTDKDDDSQWRAQLRGVLESVKGLGVEAIVTKEGLFRSAKPDLQGVPRSSQLILSRFNEQMMASLEALSLHLPNKDVQPGETWTLETHFPIVVDRTTQNALTKTTAKFVGVRVRDGREEAIVELTGRVSQDQSGGRGGDGGGRRGGGAAPDDGSRGGNDDTGRGGDESNSPRRGIRGDAHGAAVIDVATGLVVIARVESDMAAIFKISVPLRNGQSRDLNVHAGLYIDTTIRRSLNKDKPKEVSPETLLPNQPKTYNPLVGAADPAELAALTPETQSPVGVPERNTTMKREVFEKASNAAVMIRVHKSGGGGEGSGWFAEPGIVVTNCHVVDMLDKTDRPPEKIDIILNSGTDRQRILDGELLTISRIDDLAVIRVKGDNLPEPFKTVSQDSLIESQRLSVLGFPRGSSLVKSIGMGLGARDLRTQLKARTTTVVGRVPNVDGSIKYVQLEGGADPGNSGGAIVDEKGEVRLILVAGMPGTEMRFAIPSEYAARIVQGYPQEIDASYAYMDGSVAKQPISILFGDPLKRLKKVWVDCWVGSPGKPRQGGTKEPTPKPGDGPRTTLEVPFAPDKTGLFVEAKCELPLPSISPGQIYYFQPRFINGTGEVQWGQAMPYAPDGPPVERKPAPLFVKHVKGAPRYMELTSSMFHATQRLLESKVEGEPMRALYSEQVAALTKGGGAKVNLQCTEFTWRYLDDKFFDEYRELFDEIYGPEFVRLLKAFMQYFKAIVNLTTVGPDGQMKGWEWALPNNTPLQARFFFPKLNEQMMLSLKALSIPLPNKEVPYGHTWKQTTNLFVPSARRFESGVFEMNFKYLGVRDRGGRKEAVIEINGQLSRDKDKKSVELKGKDDADKDKGTGNDDETKPDDTSKPSSSRYQYAPKGKDKDKDGDDAQARRGLFGVGRGFAYVDIDGGYVSQCELFVDLEVEMMVRDRDTKQEIPQMVSGVMDVRLKRMNSPGKAK